MIFYTKCLCRAADKFLAKKYRDMGYEIRDVRSNLDWRREAKSYHLKLPFIVVDGEAKEL